MRKKSDADHLGDKTVYFTYVLFRIKMTKAGKKGENSSSVKKQNPRHTPSLENQIVYRLKSFFESM